VVFGLGKIICWVLALKRSKEPKIYMEKGGWDRKVKGKIDICDC
jgi:hypothetical protein